jgi:integrase
VPGNPYYFLGRGDVGHVKWVQKLWERVRERAGLPDLQIRDLRHNAGGWLAQLGTNQFAVRDVLGHGDVATTNRYVNPVSEHARAAAEALGEALMGVIKGNSPESPERPALGLVKEGA